MKIRLFASLPMVLFIISCTTYKSPYPRDLTYTGQVFTIGNEKGEKLFDVVAPNGTWETYDRSKAGVSQDFEFMYKGPNQGMINAEIRIMYLDSTSPGETLEEARNETTIVVLNNGLAHLLDKDNPNNLQDFYKPQKINYGIRNIANIHCSYYSFLNHSGPALDTPTAKFRGLGSGRKEAHYFCPVMRDGKPWFLGIDITYSLSDVAIQNGLHINFYKMIKDFDRMLKPTLESLKLYGKLKQY